MMDVHKMSFDFESRIIKTIQKKIPDVCLLDWSSIWCPHQTCRKFLSNQSFFHSEGNSFTTERQPVLVKFISACALLLFNWFRNYYPQTKFCAYHYMYTVRAIIVQTYPTEGEFSKNSCIWEQCFFFRRAVGQMGSARRASDKKNICSPTSLYKETFYKTKFFTLPTWKVLHLTHKVQLPPLSETFGKSTIHSPTPENVFLIFILSIPWHPRNTFPIFCLYIRE